MTTPTTERHPVSLLVDALIAALVAASAPTKVFCGDRVYLLPDDTVVPEEAQPPFYGIVVRDARLSAESADDQEWLWPIEIGAYQVLEAPTLGGRQTGLTPYTDGSHAGLLDLTWAANRTIRGRHLGTTVGRFYCTGETATALVIAGEKDSASALVRRAVKFEFAVGVPFTPLT